MYTCCCLWHMSAAVVRMHADHVLISHIAEPCFAVCWSFLSRHMQGGDCQLYVDNDHLQERAGVSHTASICRPCGFIASATQQSVIQATYFCTAVVRLLAYLHSTPRHGSAAHLAVWHTVATCAPHHSNHALQQQQPLWHCLPASWHRQCSSRAVQKATA
jgi:hypothetical protein